MPTDSDSDLVLPTEAGTRAEAQALEMDMRKEAERLLAAQIDRQAAEIRGLEAVVLGQQNDLAELGRLLRPVAEFVARCGPPKAVRQEPDQCAVSISSGPCLGACLTLGDLRRLAARLAPANPVPPTPQSGGSK